MKIDFTKYKAVIFDFDGTLYAPNKIGVKLVLGDIFNALKAKKEREVRKSMMGIDCDNKDEFYKEYFSRLGEKNKDWYFNRYMPLMVNILKNKFEARPNAQIFLDKLQANGLHVAVLSDYAMVKERMDAIHLSLPDNLLFSSETLGALKPSARPFLFVAAQLGVSPSDCLMIGDRPDTDYKGSTSVGMDCVLVHTKKNDGADGVMDWDDIVASL